MALAEMIQAGFRNSAKLAGILISSLTLANAKEIRRVKPAMGPLLLILPELGNYQRGRKLCHREDIRRFARMNLYGNWQSLLENSVRGLKWNLGLVLFYVTRKAVSALRRVCGIAGDAGSRPGLSFIRGSLCFPVDASEVKIILGLLKDSSSNGSHLNLFFKRRNNFKVFGGCFVRAWIVMSCLAINSKPLDDNLPFFHLFCFLSFLFDFHTFLL